MKWNAADEFVLERWDEVIRLVGAVRSVEEKLERVFDRASENVAAWLATEGYQASAAVEYAEVQAFRQTWCPNGTDPIVYLAVGGLSPNGSRKVDCPAPYLWVYVKNPGKQKVFDRSLRRKFSARLRQDLQGERATWTNDDVDDIHQPLGLYLPGYDLAARRALAIEADTMVALAKEQFPRLFSLSDRIDKVLKATLTEKE